MSERNDPPQLDFSRLKLKPRAQREHKVEVSALGRALEKGCSFAEWFDALPDLLGAQELRRTVEAIVAARRAGRPVVFALGGHVIKSGCSPLVIDLIEREEVGETICDGSFGMVRETCARMNEAARRGADGRGLGRALGELLDAGDAPYKHLSVFIAAARAGIPATVHVAIGTDTVHVYPDADGAALGTATLADFRAICAVVAQLGAAQPTQTGGVWLNVGSAVVMPEVFLKAVSVARNLGHSLDEMHTANLDMLRHYRPMQNVILRPVQPGHGHAVIGHHELLLPLLRQAVLERLES